MNSNGIQQRVARYAIAVAQICSLVAAAMIGSSAQIQSASAAGAVSGRVFQDFNGNGVLDASPAVDRGVAGVTVTAYDSTGTARGSATTNATGNYSIASLAGTGPYRIEFTTLPTGFFASKRSTDSVADGGNTASNAGSTVQFIPEGGATNVNLAVNTPSDYCQNNPNLATCLYWQGDQNTGVNNVEKAFIGFPYTSGAAQTTNTVPPYDSPAPNFSLNANQIGTTFGLAYDRTDRKIFIGAYFKKHAGFGRGANNTANDADDLGAIYRYNLATNGIDTIFTVPDTGANAHNIANYVTDNGNTAFGQVGKISLGGMDITDDGSRLFVMNLNNRTLYAMNPDTGAVLGTQAVPLTGLATPGGTAATCASGDVRPFAVEFYRDTLYVGAVCSAESTNSATNLHAYIWSVNPTTLAFTGPIFTFPLTYNREFVDNPPTKPAEWNPWQANFIGLPAGDLAPGYPQPIFASIQFDANGDLILGLRDRYGDQMGNQAPSNPASASDYTGISGGDLLRACRTGATTWVIEGSAGCAQANTGEYYGGTANDSADGWYPSNDSHDEVLMGGVLQVPGYPDVVSTSFNPIPGNAGAEFYDSGVRWISNTSGRLTRAYRTRDGGFADGKTFAKAGGIGELVALCDSAPIEIGNRIWRDTNDNGIQDPGEPPIAGVTVQLFQNNVLVGTAVTDANGEYYFESSAAADPTPTDNVGQVNGGISPVTQYEIRVSISQAPLAGLALAKQNVDTSATPPPSANNSNDSDAALSSGSAVITLITGGPGANNHTYDIGFVQPQQTYSLGNRVWIDANNNGLIDAADGATPGLDGVTVNLYSAAGGAPISTTTTSGGGYYRFDNLAAGDYIVEIVKPAGYASSTVDGGDADADDDPDTDVDDSDDNGVIETSTTVRSNPVTLGPGDSEPTGEADLGPGGSGAPDARSNLTVDFGLYRLLSLGNRVWADANDNGLLDGGETGLSGVTVNLYLDSNNDGTPDTATPLAVTTTNSTGFYLFSNLTATTYIVEVVAPAGYRSSTPDGGDADADDDPDSDSQDSDDNGIGIGTGAIRSLPVTLTPGGEPTGEVDADPSGTPDANSNLTVDFGLVPPAVVYSLGNRVWYDLNNNGNRDASELGIPTVKVNLYLDSNGDGLADGAPIATTTTDANGYYRFDGLAAGNYVVEVENPVGYFSSSINGGDPDTSASDVDDNGIIDSVAPGGAKSTRSAAVTLGPGDSEPTGETDLGPGDPGATDARSNLTVDFGFYRGLSLGNEVWIDDNDNGLKDSGEIGLGGVAVTLYANNGGQPGAIVSTTVTDGNGNYLFANLPAGDYIVEITAPPRYSSSTPDAGDPDADQDDKDDNGIGSGTGVIRSAPVTLTPSGEPTGETPNTDPTTPDNNSNLTVDFGLVPLGALGDYVWLDANKNGIQDEGEAPVPGVTVILQTPSGVTITQQTDANGKYLFDNLPPGTYYVTFTLPNGYVFTPSGQGGDAAKDSNANTVTGGTGPINLGRGEVNLTIDAGLYADLAISKSVESVNPSLKRNDVATYTLIVRNVTSAAVTNVVVTDTLPGGMTYVTGSSTPAPISTSPSMVWQLPSLAAQSTATIKFAVRVTDIPDSQLGFENQAVMLGNSTVITSNKVVKPFDPTVVTLERLSVKLLDKGAAVMWRTSMERNTLGFNVLRSTNGRLEDAVQVNDLLIASVGLNSGGQYEYVDLNGAPGATYWLQEIEISGVKNLYGPAQLPSATQPSQPTIIVTEKLVMGGVPVAIERADVALAIGTFDNAQSIAKGKDTPITLNANIATNAEQQNTFAIASEARQQPASVVETVAQQPAPIKPEQRIASPQTEPTNANGFAATTDNVRAEGVVDAAKVLRGSVDPSELSSQKPANVQTTASRSVGIIVGVFAGMLLLVAANGLWLTILRRKK